MVRREAQAQDQSADRGAKLTAWLTPDDVAAALRCSVEKARALIRSQMAFVQVGRRGVRVSPAEFARFEALHCKATETAIPSPPTAELPLPTVNLRPVSPRTARTASRTRSRTS